MPAEIIKAFLHHLPDSSGVYRMLGEGGDALYIGKAKSLKKRVQAYTMPEKHPYRLQRMIFQTAQMEYISTRTEAEALLLEAQLIRKLKPRYNILLKDDKSFPYITLSLSHDFPRIAKHRGVKNAKDIYFGPFASGKDVQENIRFLQKTFLVRPCKDSFFETRKRPCLEYQIKRCSAPCVGKISAAEYGAQVKEVVAFLKGRQHDVKDRIAQAMDLASANMNYEKAAELRDRLKSLSSMQSKHSFRTEHMGDVDVIALYRSDMGCAVDLFTIRGGQACGNRAFFPTHTEDSTDGEIMENFLARLYQVNPPPPLLLLNLPPENTQVLEEALSSLVPYAVKIELPQRGEKVELVSQIAVNAKAALVRKNKDEEKNNLLLKEVQNIFGLVKTPRRIEVYDNSHISGQMPVGGMIVAGIEGFIKSDYRHYKLDSPHPNPLPQGEGEYVKGGDDYAMMRFVFTKRLKRLIKETDEEKIPDLMLIDGGAGHLSSVTEVFETLGVKVPYVCISKGVDRNAGREEFHQLGKPAFRIPQGSPVLYYLQRLRDEAHRFAISTHRNRRSKAITTSALDAIQGIGAKRKKALLQHFGGVEGIKNATLAELCQVEGINKKTAEEILRVLVG